MAASLANHAAINTSAFLPVTVPSPSSSGITKVSARMPANPSICAPNEILTTSPAFKVIAASGSDARGDKCATALFGEIEVGKAIPTKSVIHPRHDCSPLAIFLPLYTFPVSSSRRESPFWQISRRFAPGVHASLTFARTFWLISAAVLSFVKVSGLARE